MKLLVTMHIITQMAAVLKLSIYLRSAAYLLNRFDSLRPHKLYGVVVCNPLTNPHT
jgi:hypothetical protein